MHFFGAVKTNTFWYKRQGVRQNEKKTPKTHTHLHYCKQKNVQPFLFCSNKKCINIFACILSCLHLITTCNFRTTIQCDDSPVHKLIQPSSSLWVSLQLKSVTWAKWLRLRMLRKGKHFMYSIEYITQNHYHYYFRIVAKCAHIFPLHVGHMMKFRVKFKIMFILWISTNRNCVPIFFRRASLKPAIKWAEEKRICIKMNINIQNKHSDWVKYN